MVKRLRCYFGRHRFQKRRAEDGKWFMECRFCGKFRDIPEQLPPAFWGI
jgi:hypothetical protein